VRILTQGISLLIDLQSCHSSEFPHSRLTQKGVGTLLFAPNRGYNSIASFVVDKITGRLSASTSAAIPPVCSITPQTIAIAEHYGAHQSSNHAGMVLYAAGRTSGSGVQTGFALEEHFVDVAQGRLVRMHSGTLNGGDLPVHMMSVELSDPAARL
jgi:hypothetical protein